MQTQAKIDLQFTVSLLINLAIFPCLISLCYVYKMSEHSVLNCSFFVVWCIITTSEGELDAFTLIIIHNSVTYIICVSPIEKGISLKMKCHIWLQTHIKLADNKWKEFFFIGWSWKKKNTAALGSAPSGLNTLKAFISGFIATKSFHPWFPALFRQSWNWVSLCFFWCHPSR